MSDWRLDTPREVDALLGACLILRRAALDQIGLLDESYFVYSEEIDLCYRLRKASWTLNWVPQAQIVHYGGQSTQQVAKDMFLRLYQGKLLYFRKHHGRLAARIYKSILLVTAAARLLLSPLAWLERPLQRRQHLALAGNYWHLLTTLRNM
jgi:GT2 family glycosyltransferase